MRVLIRSILLTSGLCLLALVLTLTIVRWQPPKQWFLFESFQSGGVHLYRARDDGAAVQRLTTVPVIDLEVHWSPRKAWLLLVNYQSTSVEWVRLRPQGLNQYTYPLPFSNRFDFQLWLPDEQGFIVSAVRPFDQASGLYRLQTNDRALEIISDQLDVEALRLGISSQMFLSPDQQWLYFFNASTLYRLNLEDKRSERVFRKEGLFSRFRWSSDGQRLYFSFSDKTDRTSIYRITPDGTYAQELTPQFKESFLDDVVQEGQGDWLIFTADDSDLYHMRSDGSQLRNISNMNHEVAFQSRQGDWIYFASNFNGKLQLYRVRLDGSQKKLLTDPSRWNIFETWSPDGGWIIFQSVSDEDNHYDIARMRPDGRQRQYLTNTPNVNDLFAAFSPDQQWLYFTSDREGRSKIFRMHPDGSTVQQITATMGDDHFLDWIPIVDLAWRAERGIVLSALLIAAGFLPHRKNRL